MRVRFSRVRTMVLRARFLSSATAVLPNLRRAFLGLFVWRHPEIQFVIITI